LTTRKCVYCHAGDATGDCALFLRFLLSDGRDACKKVGAPVRKNRWRNKAERRAIVEETLLPRSHGSPVQKAPEARKPVTPNEVSLEQKKALFSTDIAHLRLGQRDGVWMI